MATAIKVDYAAQINQIFTDLGIDTDVDPCSGVMAENVSKGVVKIFDDQESGVYYADQVIELLKGGATIEWDDIRNVWQVISDAEVSA